MINKTVEAKGPEMASEDVKSNNVILFPGISKNRPPQSIEEICRNVELAKTARIEDAVEEVVVELFENLFSYAFDFSQRDDANKDMAFLIEALKSVLAKHDGLEHPFQQLAEKYFVANANGDLSFVEGTTTYIRITEEEGEAG